MTAISMGREDGREHASYGVRLKRYSVLTVGIVVLSTSLLFDLSIWLIGLGFLLVVVGLVSLGGWSGDGDRSGLGKGGDGSGGY
ncbi:hypothetical protein [Sulfitobacter sp. JB4-11]|uniref:hypothetical protein n=1 Tax=Sulfitobacter rhodophyticola TaxID=3238304 RepID=UPI0035113D0E